MRNIFKITFLCLSVLGTILYSSDTQAFFLTKLLKSASIEIPMPDFVGEAVATLKSVGGLASSGMKLKNATETNLNNVKTALTSVFNFNYTALVDGQKNPGQLEIISCELKDYSVDVYDKEKVEEAIQYLFFQQPGWEAAARENYKAKNKKFYEDTVIEIYTASRQLQKDMIDRVVPTIDEAKKCVKGDAKNCGIPSPDGNSEAAYSEAKALESIDNVLMILQKAIALKAQLRAAKAINGIPPKPFEALPDEVEETPNAAGDNMACLNQDDAMKLASNAVFSSELPLAFAQVGMTSSNAQAASSLVAAEDAASELTSSKMLVGRALNFNQAPESEIFHPYDIEQEKMDELDKMQAISDDTTLATDSHNMIRELKSYQNAAKTYNEAVEDHKKAVESIKASDKCAIAYLGRRFAQPELVWSGQPLGDNVADYTLRRGISGWAVEAYDTAKAAQVSTVTAEDIATPDMDMQEEDYTDVGNPDKNLSVVDKQTTFTNVSKEEQSQKENREALLLSWQSGSEAAKLLMEEPQKWGTMIKPFPVWNDVKSFYNQYLSGKYANIHTLLESYTTDDVKAVVVAALSGTQKDISETSKQKQLAKINEELTKELEKLVKEKQKAAEKFTDEKNPEMIALRNRRISLLKTTDAAADKYKAISDELADARAKIQDDASDSMREEVTDFDSYDEHTNDLNVTGDKVSVPAGVTVAAADERRASNAWNTGKKLTNKFNERVEENKEESSIEELQKKLDAQNKVVENLRKQLTELDQQIKHKKLENQKAAAKVAEDFAEEFKKLQIKVDASRKKIGHDFAKGVDANIKSIAGKIVEELMSAFRKANPDIKIPYKGPTVASLTSGLDAAVSSALDALYSRVTQRINIAQNQMADMGDKLYMPEYHDQVVAIHTSMINDIAAFPLIVSYKEMKVAITVYIYKNLPNNDITAEEKDFFVGSPAKIRDLKAPRKVLEFNLPPLREVVHFDEVDFQNVKPYEHGRDESENIPYDDFLKYGGEIPEIWTYMLTDHAFVETDFELKKALNISDSCNAATFFRGGFMPCKIKNSSVALDINPEGKYTSGSGASKTNLCPFIEIKNGRPHDTSRDIDLQMSRGSVAQDCSYSELGTLLDADDFNNIFFRKPIYEAFYTMLEQQAKTERNEELSDDEQKKAAPYDAAVLSNNQVGDFLKYVDNEKIKKAHLDEVKADYDEMMATLRELLAKYGFEPSEDFDISKDEDYELARSKLDSLKNKKIASALEKIADVNVTDNEVVEERVQKFKNVIAALQKDKDEMTTITDAVIDNNNLDEELKTSKVNEDVSNKYEEDMNKLNDKTNLPTEPYCANY